MNKISLTLELDIDDDDFLSALGRIAKAVQKPVTATQSPLDRRALERQLLEAYQQAPNGFEWWQRTALHKRLFGERHYSAAAFYNRRAGLFELRGDRYVLSERGRARLAELSTEAVASA
jgi:hypothetical protein